MLTNFHKEKHKMKRILSLILCVIMVIAVVPMTATTVAAETQWASIYTRGATTIAEGGAEVYEIDIFRAQEKIEISLDWTFGDNRGGNAISINGKSLMSVSNKSKQTRITVNGGGSQISNLNNVLLTIEVTIYLQETVVGETTYAVGDAYTVVTNTTNGATSKGKINVLPEGATDLGATLTLKFGTLSQKTAKFDNLNVYTCVAKSELENTIWLDGYQRSEVNEAKYNVRFASVLSEIPEGAENVGFEIAAPAFSKSWDIYGSTVYESINASFGAETITAAECGGKYITAAAITNIPVGMGTIKFIITPYVTVAGVKLYGNTKTVLVAEPQHSDYESVMLADAPIEKFKIAVPSNEYNDLASQIALELSRYNGYIIPTVNYSELKATDKNVICIGAHDKSGESVLLDGHKGYLLSSDFEDGVITGIQASSFDYCTKAVQRWLDNLTVTIEGLAVDLTFFENSTYLFDTDKDLPQWYLTSETVVELADGITYLMQSFKNEKGEPYKAYSLIVDPTKNSFRMGCSNDGYDYTVTESANRQTVKGHMEAAIANGYNVIGAVNADFFDINGDYHPTGLTIKEGQLISRGASRPYLAFTEDGTVFIGENGKTDNLSGIVTAVGGRNVLVRDGLPGDFEDDLEMDAEFGYTAHPRTIVGIREDGTVIFTVIDGRQTSVSNGAPLARCANYMISLGAVTAINLDGGGSSTLITRVGGQFVTRNSPSDGNLRKVYNSVLIIGN